MPQGFTHHNVGGVCFLTIPAFDKAGCVRHCFTTRLGGVSKPPLDTMNLGFGRGDDPEAMRENYRIIGRTVGFDPERVVSFHQVHGSDVYIAEESDAGIGFSEGRPCYDGILTRARNLPLMTFHADCVPVFLLDPVTRTAGVVHAGWRGTALKIAGRAVERMRDDLGCRIEDILAAVGPCGGACCYETDGDVPEAMHEAFGAAVEPYLTKKGAKWHVDLAGLNGLALRQIGILDKNLTMSNECTCCRDDLYWSHRKTNGVRGCMAAIIMLV